jgi:Peroxisomal membrane protein (Pex16)
VTSAATRAATSLRIEYSIYIPYHNSIHNTAIGHVSIRILIVHCHTHQCIGNMDSRRPPRQINADALRPSKWLSSYEDLVTANVNTVNQIESALRSLTYIIPGNLCYSFTPLGLT